MCLLAWRLCRAWASSASGGFPCSQQVVGKLLPTSLPIHPPITPFGPAALRGDHPGPSVPSPAFRVSNPPMGSPLFLLNPLRWSWKPECPQETSPPTTSSCWRSREGCIRLKRGAQAANSNASEIQEGWLCTPVTQHTNNLHSGESKQERKQLRRRTSVYV